MIKLKETKCLYVDVDNTLVFSASEFSTIKNPRKIVINNREFVVHVEHIELMRDFKARGHNIIVWSAGGSDWAESVVRHLYLDDIVDVVVGKPDWYIDDLPCDRWIPESNRTYINLPKE